MSTNTMSTTELSLPPKDLTVPPGQFIEVRRATGAKLVQR
jgi:hypothetical protein